MITIESQAIINNNDLLKILDSITDSLLIIDVKKKSTVYFNKSAYQSLGYSKDEFIKKDFLFFINHTDFDFVEISNKVLFGETIYFNQYYKKKDGTTQYGDFHVFSIESKKNNLICLSWSNITSKVNFFIEQRIRKNRFNQFLETLEKITNSSEYLTGNPISFSKEITKTVSEKLGIDRVSIRLYSEDKSELISLSLYDKNLGSYLVGKKLTRVEYPEVFSFLENHTIINISNLNQTPLFQNMVDLFFSKDGNINALLGSRILLEGNLKGYLLFQSRTKTDWDRDSILFSNQIATHMSIMLLNSQINEQKHILEEKVTNRTNALLLSKQEAERANQAKSKFLSNISHELRTPLNAIIGFLSLINSDDIKNESEMYLERIKAGSNDLLSIINDVLDFSKIESGKMEYNPSWVDLESFSYNIKSFYQSIFETSTIAFKTSILIKNKMFYIDQKILKQILHNLLSNALKFTTSGYVYFEITELEKEVNKSFLKIIVKDTGIGIKSEDIEKLFNPFSQFDNNSEQKGTGLGLLITKELVNLFDGNINVESKVGIGTEFIVTIPNILTSGKNDPVKKAETNTLIPSNSFENFNILIVEDNKINQELLKLSLNDYKMNIDLADNGFEALKSTHKLDYAFILMDIHMPILDGINSTKLIRLTSTEYQPKIIAITANAFEFEGNSFLDSGFDDYLVKPITKNQLVKKIYELSKKSTNVPKSNDKESLVELIVQLTNLNIENGLKYTGNNKDLYFKLLHDFLTKHNNDLTLSLKSLQNKDLEESYRFIHTLKSLLKMFGIEQLYTKIVNIESLYKEAIYIEKIENELLRINNEYEFIIYLLKYIFLNKEREYGI